MRYRNFLKLGLFFLLTVPIFSQSDHIELGYVDNSDGKYHECGKKLSLPDDSIRGFIFVFANDETEMNIDGQAIKLALVKSTEKIGGTPKKGEEFEEVYRAIRFKIVIRYRVSGFSDDTARYTGSLTARKGKLRKTVRFEGSSGC